MAMIAKGPDPTMGIFDGFDPKTVYQMIPVSGVRTGFKIVSAEDPVDIEIRPAGIARFNNKRCPVGRNVRVRQRRRSDDLYLRSRRTIRGPRDTGGTRSQRKIARVVAHQRQGSTPENLFAMPVARHATSLAVAAAQQSDAAQSTVGGPRRPADDGEREAGLQTTSERDPE